MHNYIFQVVIFGYVTELAHFYNIYFYGAIWVLNGLIQATGWPTVVAVMGNWFGKSRLVMQTSSSSVLALMLYRAI